MVIVTFEDDDAKRLLSSLQRWAASHERAANHIEACSCSEGYLDRKKKAVEEDREKSVFYGRMAALFEEEIEDRVTLPHAPVAQPG